MEYKYLEWLNENEDLARLATLYVGLAGIIHSSNIPSGALLRWEIHSLTFNLLNGHRFFQ